MGNEKAERRLITVFTDFKNNYRTVSREGVDRWAKDNGLSKKCARTYLNLARNVYINYLKKKR